MRYYFRHSLIGRLQDQGRSEACMTDLDLSSLAWARSFMRDVFHPQDYPVVLRTVPHLTAVGKGFENPKEKEKKKSSAI